MFLSSVPEGTDIKTYDGSGEWVKIFTLGVEFRIDPTATEPMPSPFWLPFHDGKLSPKIPRQTPPGKYLLRIHQNWAGALPGQIYPPCAHIEVTPDPEVKPNLLPKGVKIPEALCAECPGESFLT
ncbi:hypothetical protein BU23DRAFT_205702 [Bimuria novae-zelandiae CBS 107.79]|uniref:AA9 family lytic polysaccharide monooxygenase n=1 Tax=Bimuria novae-zelandiae CBS 107.79 TaxID=1447943 RepID=A0A6A5V6L0_9PLEO|nr:hypothetical protein BU23DRAFT_205702 [Bimuria novae-zelandiae CBS 107.79]